MRQIDSKHKTSGDLTKNDGTPIPEDEPLVLFRGHDKVLPDLLEHYNQLCQENGSPPAQIEAMDQLIAKIKQWQADNPDKVKVAD